MENIIIIGVLIVLVVIGFQSTIKHFKGKSGCCGGSSTVISKKKLNHVIGKKIITVEGMTCENCKNRVERYINEIDGIAGKVNLKKKELTVIYEKEISDEDIKAVIEKAGYKVIKIVPTRK